MLTGLVLFGKGFVVTADEARTLEDAVCHPFLGGRDLVQDSKERWVIDFYPLDEQGARSSAPRAFQRVLDRVKPERDHIRDKPSRVRWWRFGRDKAELRRTLSSISRCIVTPEVSKHGIFAFVSSNVRPDHKLVVVASDDGFVFGVLSSRVHRVWALATGSRLGVGDDPVYSKSRGFDPFPFPVQGQLTPRIRELGERLDAHRKRQQSHHPDLTLTGTYNVLEKLRSGEVLKQTHDDLDAAVFDAYDWPHNVTDEQILERLVALNTERADEERSGLVRWLRPDFQNPGGTTAATQTAMPGIAEEAEAVEAVAAAATWPKRMAEQVAAVRDLLLLALSRRRSRTSWTRWPPSASWQATATGRCVGGGAWPEPLTARRGLTEQR